MAKKSKTKKEEEIFDLEKELKDYPCPDWYKRAFLKTYDTSKIKNRNDMEKAILEYGRMT